jgi:hypothetical protein
MPDSGLGTLRAVTKPGPHPVASRMARWQAAHGTDLTSLADTTVRMEDPAACRLIMLLDGTCDRHAIRAAPSAEDLDANLAELARLFLLEPT